MKCLFFSSKLCGEKKKCCGGGVFNSHLKICRIGQDVVKGCVLDALGEAKQNRLKWKIVLVLGWAFQDTC